MICEERGSAFQECVRTWPREDIDMKMKDFAQYLNNVSFDEALYSGREFSDRCLSYH